ncbi:MAG: hypothetical protein OEZ47_10010 [Gammaproteobacteria bacterium]|nr:hypothetical protein [Gammaproteobacteria bacterium]
MKYILLLFFSFLVGPIYASERLISEAVRVGIRSSFGDEIYEIYSKNENEFTLKDVDLTSQVRVSNYWDKFKDIENSILKDKITSKLVSSLRRCEEINGRKLDIQSSENVYGNASPPYQRKEKRNIVFSPDNNYAIVKSAYDTYSLLNTKTLNFEKACILAGREVAWKKSELVAVSIEHGEGGSPNKIYIYDISIKREKVIGFKSEVVQGIKWLQSGNILAVVTAQDEDPTGFLNALNFFLRPLGHPVQQTKFKIYLYSYEEERILSTLISIQKGNAYSFIQEEQD